ncbi:citrate transporter [Alcanivorax sp. S71-1-4]|uniref:SLC13 family permease n=1 Tax=Alcanivorax sp. S71-1-4 TaxID=1177159 RepID=UPI0016991A7B|nr:SLC13 family permease [Alcanivorax sp. S71-1-4]KAF0808260.1 citrate transporter [Alcanivorax sp. S71-1-4]
MLKARPPVDAHAMEFPHYAMLGLLLLVLVLFVWGRWRYDVVALMAMLAVVLAGWVPAEEALAGFGHPAVITVAAVLTISRALVNAGTVDLITSRLLPLTGSVYTHIGALCLAVGFASAFMNNVGALALMLPVALASARKRERPPGLLLMPLAFASLLGGLATLIGTPPNIIIATYRADRVGEAFSMFDFTPVGGLVALIGLVFLSVIGWRLLPRGTGANRISQVEIDNYICEARLTEDSPLVGMRIGSLPDEFTDDALPVGLVRGKGEYLHPHGWRVLEQGDLLILRADPGELRAFLDRFGLELVASKLSGLENVKPGELRLVEVSVPPRSVLEGRDSAFLRRRTGHTVGVVALARSGTSIHTRLRDQLFRAGDVLLLQGEPDSLDDSIAELGLLPLAERDIRVNRPMRALTGLVVFAAALALGATVMPIAIALLLAVVVYVMLDLLPVRDLYRDIDWPVLVLLGGMMAVGQALQSTGTTEVLVSGIIQVTDTLSPLWVLALLLVVTMFLSDVVNNAATALVMAPIAYGVAQQLGVNPDAFLMAVAIGASCAFLTPIGHQSNTLVMGPGGYRFGDYWRVGLPLEILIVVVAVPAIAWFWPLS